MLHGQRGEAWPGVGSEAKAVFAFYQMRSRPEAASGQPSSARSSESFTPHGPVGWTGSARLESAASSTKHRTQLAPPANGLAGPRSTPQLLGGDPSARQGHRGVAESSPSREDPLHRL